MGGRKLRVSKEHGLKGSQCRLRRAFRLVEALDEGRRRPFDRRRNKRIPGRKVTKDRGMTNANFTGNRFGSDRAGIVRGRERHKCGDQRGLAFRRTQAFGLWAWSHTK